MVDPALHDAWITELRSRWTHYNAECLDGHLDAPQIVLLESDRVLGSWDRERRLLGIAASHIRTAPWLDVLATLRHEMAHQYVDEHLGGSATPHDELFRAACRRLRVDPAATAAPTKDGAHGDDPTRIRLLRRVEKLLSLASSPNENEAGAAFRKAQRILVEHNLAPPDATASYAAREIGDVRRRHHAWEFVLANILDDFFFVDVIWGAGFDAATARRGTVLRAYGTATNLDMAEYVHRYITGVLPALWEDHRASRGIPGNRDRLRYFHGVLLGFRQKLAAARRSMRDVEGLVVADDPRRAEFFQFHNPRVQTIRRGGARDSDAVRDGEAVGRRLSIRRPIGPNGSPGRIGLLPHE